MRQTRLLKPSNIVIQKAVSSTELKKKYEIKVNKQKRVTRKAGKTKVKKLNTVTKNLKEDNLTDVC